MSSDEAKALIKQRIKNAEKMKKLLSMKNDTM